MKTQAGDFYFSSSTPEGQGFLQEIRDDIPGGDRQFSGPFTLLFNQTSAPVFIQTGAPNRNQRVAEASFGRSV